MFIVAQKLWSYPVTPGYHHQYGGLLSPCRAAPDTPTLCLAMQIKAHPKCHSCPRKPLDLSFASRPSIKPSIEETPEEEQDDDSCYARDRTILLEKQFPVYADCRALVLGRVLAQTAAHVAHLVQAVAAVEQVVDVLGHGFVHVLELIVQSVHVVLRPAVLVEFLCALEEAFKLGVGIRA